MAGQAGWYHAPGEEGLLRYWNGTAWTDHRQPEPAAAPQPVAAPSLEDSAAEAAEPQSNPDTVDLDLAALGLSATDEPEPIEPELQQAELQEPQAPDDEQAPAEQMAPVEPDWSMDQFEKQFETSDESVRTFEPNFELVRDTPLSEAPQQDAPAPTPDFSFVPPAPTVPAESFTPPLAPSAPLSHDAGATASAFAGAAQQSPVLEATALEMPLSSFSPPALAPEAPGSLAGAPAPFAMPSAEPAATVSLANAPAPAPEAPAPTVVDQPTARSSAAPQAEARLVPEDPAHTARVQKRRSLIRAARGIVVGLAIIVLGVAAMYLLSLQANTLAAGQLKTVGIVTNLGQTGQSCAPSARFAAAGGSFTATTPTAVPACPVTLGQTVDVTYSSVSPSTSGRIVVPSPFMTYSWVVPAIGGVVFLASLFIFILRAGSIAAGISLIREGERRRRRSQTPAAPADGAPLA